MLSLLRSILLWRHAWKLAEDSHAVEDIPIPTLPCPTCGAPYPMHEVGQPCKTCGEHPTGLQADPRDATACFQEVLNRNFNSIAISREKLKHQEYWFGGSPALFYLDQWTKMLTARRGTPQEVERIKTFLIEIQRYVLPAQAFLVWRLQNNPDSMSREEKKSARAVASDIEKARVALSEWFEMNCPTDEDQRIILEAPVYQSGETKPLRDWPEPFRQTGTALGLRFYSHVLSVILMFVLPWTYLGGFGWVYWSAILLGLATSAVAVLSTHFLLLRLASKGTAPRVVSGITGLVQIIEIILSFSAPFLAAVWLRSLGF